MSKKGNSFRCNTPSFSYDADGVRKKSNRDTLLVVLRLFSFFLFYYQPDRWIYTVILVSSVRAWLSCGPRIFRLSAARVIRLYFSRLRLLRQAGNPNVLRWRNHTFVCCAKPLASPSRSRACQKMRFISVRLRSRRYFSNMRSVGWNLLKHDFGDTKICSSNI